MYLLSEYTNQTTMEYTFKLVYTGDSVQCVIDPRWSVLHAMNEVLFPLFQERFQIDNWYDIELVRCGQYGSGDPELAPCINVETDVKFVEKFKHVHAFYVRPVHPITKEFVRQNSYMRMVATEVEAPLENGTT